MLWNTPSRSVTATATAVNIILMYLDLKNKSLNKANNNKYIIKTNIKT